ncbi:MAG: hydrogenase small subunit [Acidobacteria bacterium]|nr:hydrogenase small subunit [Acidobacteriota bacterium]
MAHSDSRTIENHLRMSGVSRRDFVRLCSALMVTAPAGLALTSTNSVDELAKAVGHTPRPSVIWLHFQECTGCTETLLRTSAPDVGHLILDVISLDYHETLMAAAGDQAEQALHAAMQKNSGRYVLVAEGSIPLKDNGGYLELGRRRGLEVLKEAASGAAAIVAIGSCASWGGVQSSGENPTGAVGVDSIIKDKPIINLPGCPPNPYTLLAVVLEYATMGRIPALDSLKRPLFAYSRVIHDNCPRRAHFDAGRFAQAFGDDGHRQGWCLFKLGCKGPLTHGACATRHFNEVPDVWPIGIGAPCVGCTEKAVAFTMPVFQTVDLHSIPATAPDTYAPIYTPQGHISSAATGLAGLIGGALVGAGIMASRRLRTPEGGEKPGEE